MYNVSYNSMKDVSFGSRNQVQAHQAHFYLKSADISEGQN